LAIELSVVIPAFNASMTIADQVRALRKQQWDGEWEAIVVDNGSVDDTAEAARRAADGDARFIVIDGSERSGAAFARNLGVCTSQGSAIAFCDADDIVGTGWLSAIGDALRETPFVTGPQEMAMLNPE
jgi:glycosyltransferase involved in cell wall biosynthesis